MCYLQSDFGLVCIDAVLLGIDIMRGALRKILEFRLKLHLLLLILGSSGDKPTQSVNCFELL